MRLGIGRNAMWAVLAMSAIMASGSVSDQAGSASVEHGLYATESLRGRNERVRTIRTERRECRPFDRAHRHRRFGPESAPVDR